MQEEALMGSMMKADSERRELVRERRQARIERKRERRNARERKHSQIAGAPPAVSAVQRAAEERIDAAVDRIVTEALERHDQITAAGNTQQSSSEGEAGQTAEAAAPRHSWPTESPARSSTGHPGDGPRVTSAARTVGRGERRSGRERDIAEFGSVAGGRSRKCARRPASESAARGSSPA
jgi:hypothetical protein